MTLDVAGCLKVLAPRSCLATLVNPLCDPLTSRAAVACSQQFTRDPGPAAARHAAVCSPGRVVQGSGAGAGDNCQSGVPVEAVCMLTGKSSFSTRGRQVGLSPGLHEHSPGVSMAAAALAHICASSQMCYVEPLDHSRPQLTVLHSLSARLQPCSPELSAAWSLCSCFAWRLQ